MSISYSKEGPPLRSTSTRVQENAERIISNYTSEELADLLELIYDEYRNRGGVVKIDTKNFALIITS